MPDKRQLQDVYRETVLEHSRHPHHFGQLDDAELEAEGFNPLCGDKISVYLNTADEKIAQCAFQATGCAISMASASLMMDAVNGREVQRVTDLIRQVKNMFGTTEGSADDNIVASLDALAGVRAYPSRIKCATLAWQTLEAALTGETATATTE
ncbi:MAG: Fe-S cluster assembly sulfur transfer protein SufU [Gammaproteobacteria bacterium]